MHGNEKDITPVYGQPRIVILQGYLLQCHVVNAKRYMMWDGVFMLDGGWGGSGGEGEGYSALLVLKGHIQHRAVTGTWRHLHG